MSNINVTQTNSNGQQTQLSINLISRFEVNGNSYALYTKNEPVTNNLIKTYAAKEFTGTNASIVDDEWKTIQATMKNMYNNDFSNINIKVAGDNISLCEERGPLGVPEPVINGISNNCESRLSNDTNKDLLNENFATEVKDESVSNVEQTSNNNANENQNVVEFPTPTAEANSNAVEVSNIPNTNNSLDMEGTPVDLSANGSQVAGAEVVAESMPEVGTEVVANATPETIPEASVEQSVETPANNEAQTPINDNDVVTPFNPSDLEKENKEETAAPVEENKDNTIDSPFNVGGETNIFDQVPVDNNSLSDSTPVENTPLTGDNNAVVESVDNNIASNIDNNYYKKMVEFNNRKMKLYLEQVKILEEENELLNNKLLNDTNKNDVENLENTASNLFTSEGSLDSDKILAA